MNDMIPQRKLFAAILRQGIHDALSIDKPHWWDAIHWIRETDPSWEGSFENVCNLLNIDAPTIRRKVFESVARMLTDN